MRQFVFIFSILCISCSLYAQNEEIDIAQPKFNTNGLYIAIVPSALMNPWTGFQTKFNYGFADIIQLQLNLGRLHGKRGGYPFRGYRVRPGVKLFLPLGDQIYDRFYIGIEYNIRKITESGEAVYARFGGLFQEKLPFERITKSRSFIFSFGSRSEMNKRLYIETGLGFGIGPLSVSTTQYQNAEVLRDDNSFRLYLEQGDYSMANVLIHVSLGIKLF